MYARSVPDLTLGDSPPEDGIGDIEKGLFMKFESDDYSRRTYIIVQVSMIFSELLVKKDDHGRTGTKLIRI